MVVEEQFTGKDILLELCIDLVLSVYVWCQSLQKFIYLHSIGEKQSAANFCCTVVLLY